ncbi:hypothetical protein V8C26DRAFT_43828 [Trichoderma gracile]
MCMYGVHTCIRAYPVHAFRRSKGSCKAQPTATPTGRLATPANSTISRTAKPTSNWIDIRSIPLPTSRLRAHTRRCQKHPSQAKDSRLHAPSWPPRGTGTRCPSAHTHTYVQSCIRSSHRDGTPATGDEGFLSFQRQLAVPVLSRRNQGAASKVVVDWHGARRDETTPHSPPGGSSGGFSSITRSPCHVVDMFPSTVWLTYCTVPTPWSCMTGVPSTQPPVRWRDQDPGPCTITSITRFPKAHLINLYSAPRVISIPAATSPRGSRNTTKMRARIQHAVNILHLLFAPPF